MNVASKELCEELYKLSEWQFDEQNRHIEKVWIQSFSTSEMGQGHEDYDKTPPKERRRYYIGDWIVRDNPKNFIGVPEQVPWGWANKYYQQTVDASIPAYSLGYLTRKLPPSIQENNCNYLLGLHPNYSGSGWMGIYLDNEAIEYLIQAFSDTPEDAACQLAIELIKQGVLKA